MRKRLASLTLAASLFTAFLATPHTEVLGQPKQAPKTGKAGDAKAGDAKAGDAKDAKGGDKKGGDKKGGKGGKGGKEVIDLDDDEKGGKKAADDGPVTAGQMTEEAAQAKRLFDNGKWAQAALALKKVTGGETGDDEGNKQIAQYHLAIALYNLKFYQASYALFSEIAEKPNHQKFGETLLWLARLATQLPEPANIVERVGKYDAEQIARFNNAQQKNLYWQLNYLLGRYKYNARDYDTALQLFEKVDKSSPFFVQAKFFSGISYVQRRQSVPAVKAFQAVIDALDAGGVEGVEDEARMRDLAYISMARTYYSASVRLDDQNIPKIDPTKLSAAVKYWNRVNVSSEYWLDSLFEESWAYFMAGDYPHALGNIHTLESPYFPNAFYPEASIIKAIIAFTICQYDDATTIVARMRKKYEPIKKELTVILDRYKGDTADEQFFDFLKKVRDGKADLKPEIKPVVENALSDRQLLRNIEYVRVLDKERDLFKSQDAGFKSSDLGNDITDALDLAREVAVRKAGTLARDRYQRYLDELNEHLRDSQKILIDITAAERNKIDTQALGIMTKEETDIYGVVEQDDEHELWPFNGEYWRDELGFYRQVVVSKCGKAGAKK